MGATSNHAHRLLCGIVKRGLLEEVWYQAKLILHLIFFGADYTSGTGSVWDYMTIQHSIQLARLAGNPVKLKFEFKFIYSHLFNCNTTTVRKKKKKEEVKTEITIH